MEILTDDTELTPFLTGSFVFPTVELQAPLDVNRTAFLAIFSCNLGLTTPEGDIDKCCLLSFFPTIRREDTVPRNPKIGYGTSLGSVFDFRITGDIPDQHHFVQIGHLIGCLGV